MVNFSLYLIFYMRKLNKRLTMAINWAVNWEAQDAFLLFYNRHTLIKTSVTLFITIHFICIPTVSANEMLMDMNSQNLGLDRNEIEALSSEFKKEIPKDGLLSLKKESNTATFLKKDVMDRKKLQMPFNLLKRPDGAEVPTFDGDNPRINVIKPSPKIDSLKTYCEKNAYLISGCEAFKND